MVFKAVLKSNYFIIMKVLGNLFLLFSLVLLFPVLFCLFFPEEFSTAGYAFILSAASSAVIGLLLKYIPRNNLSQEVVSIREGAVIVLFSWTIGIFVSSLPYIFSGTFDFTHAIFESTSGWTTTGLTVVTDTHSVPKLILVWRSVTQFLGGAGFAIIMMGSIIGPRGFGLYHAEGRVDNVVPNVKQSARIIARIYVIYAVAGMIALSLTGMSIFEAFNHSLTALATGGFSTRNGSIGEFNSVTIEIVTIVLMFLGATGFGIHYALWKRDFKAILKNGEPWLLLIIALVSTILIAINGLGPAFDSVGEAVRKSAFQSISALTGTGFSTVDFSVRWPGFPLGMFILTVLMILGGCMDSTSGGLKQYRIFVLLKVIIESLLSFVRPRNTVSRIEIWKGQAKRYIDENVIREILLVFSLYMITYTVGVTILCGYGFPVRDSMFEFASALSGVGLSTGITNFTAPTGVLWTLITGMFLGRLEFLVVLYAVTKLIKDAWTVIRG